MKLYGRDAPRVLVVGEALVDVVHKPGHDVARMAGGGPANVALGLGRLRVSTDFLTHIAPDDDGMLVLYGLIDAGVSLIPGSLSAPRTSTADVVVDESGHPTYRFDVAWSLPSSVDLIGIPDLLHVGSYGAFLAPGSDKVLSLAERAVSEGARVTLDPNIRPGLLGDRADVVSRFERLAALSTVVKLSEDDARWLYPDLEADDVIARIADLGASVVVLTLGAAGAMLAGGSGTLHTPAFVARAVADTVGAGDSYMAAVIHGLLHAGVNRLDGDLSWIAQRAAAAAAITVGRRGADPPWLAELNGVFLQASAT